MKNLILFIALLTITSSVQAQYSIKLKADRQQIQVSENTSFLEKGPEKGASKNNEWASGAVLQFNYYLNKHISIGTGIGSYQMSYTSDQDLQMSYLAQQLKVNQSIPAEEKNYKLVSIDVSHSYVNIPLSVQLDIPNSNTPKWQSYLFLESDLLLRTDHKVTGNYRNYPKANHNPGAYEHPGFSILVGLFSLLSGPDPTFSNTSISEEINQELAVQISPKAQLKWSVGYGFKRYFFESGYLMGEAYLVGHKNKLESAKAGFTFGIGMDFGKGKK